jgi:hypothetical protein
LNLRWNPFSEPNLDERAELAVQIPDFSLEPKKAILILGEKGRGKTTHLLTLHQKNLNAPYVHLPEFGLQPRIPRGKIIFLDEAQRLPRLTRRFIWQRAETWVIASHENHTRELQQAGFTVQIMTLTGLTLAKLEAVIEKRLEWARRSDGDIPRVAQEKLKRLLFQYGDDLRSIEGALYDEYQQMQRSNP